MAAIVIALGFGLYSLLFKKRNAQQTVKALTVRITLSVALFGLLFVAFAMRWIKPHGLSPTTNTQIQTGKAILRPQNANTTPLPQKQNDGPG